MKELSQPAASQVKVLIVDDDPLVAETLGDLLRGEGYETVTATSGMQALALAARERPSVVLLDVRLPDIDGFEVCRRIKNDPETQFLPVILVTGLSGAEQRVNGAKVGADDFITKPPNEQELLTRIKSLARIHYLHTELVSSNAQLKLHLEERSRQLEEATRELQKLLKERTYFRPGLIPSQVPAEPRLPERPAAGVESAPSEGDLRALREFRHTLLGRLSETLEGRADLSRTPETLSLLSKRLASIYDSSGLRLTGEARQRLFREILDDILGYGPIEPLLADPTVTEIMVNGPTCVFVERKGRLSKTDIQFDDDDHVLRVIDRIIRPLGRRVDRRSPMVDARLPDGSRVNVIIPPCAIDGPTITIRKFGERLRMADLINYGSLTQETCTFLEACVRSRVSILVAGGTGSGKTTFLNALSAFIPEEERIVTIEDSAELQLHQEHVVRMEARPPDVDESGEVSIRQLVRNALRMRPNRIVVGEVRGGEALDMLQAMNTGHAGSLTTIHANSPRDSIARLETLVLMAGFDLPVKAIRAQIASALSLIVQQARLRDGSRKVISITEAQGMEGDVVVLSDIFAFKEEGMEKGHVVGVLAPTGLRPRFEQRLEMAGFSLPPTIYMPPQRQAQDRLRRGRAP